MATTEDIGRALYQMLKSGETPTQAEYDPAVVARRTVSRSLTRKLPDGTIEIAEETVRDEISY